MTKNSGLETILQWNWERQEAEDVDSMTVSQRYLRWCKVLVGQASVGEVPGNHLSYAWSMNKKIVLIFTGVLKKQCKRLGLGQEVILKVIFRNNRM